MGFSLLVLELTNEGRAYIFFISLAYFVITKRMKKIITWRSWEYHHCTWLSFISKTSGQLETCTDLVFHMFCQPIKDTEVLCGSLQCTNIFVIPAWKCMNCHCSDDPLFWNPNIPKKCPIGPRDHFSNSPKTKAHSCEGQVFWKYTWPFYLTVFGCAGKDKVMWSSSGDLHHHGMASSW